MQKQAELFKTKPNGKRKRIGAPLKASICRLLDIYCLSDNNKLISDPMTPSYFQLQKQRSIKSFSEQVGTNTGFKNKAAASKLLIFGEQSSFNKIPKKDSRRYFSFFVILFLKEKVEDEREASSASTQSLLLTIICFHLEIELITMFQNCFPQKF